mmetsp:Transcript_239/g.521  ORF Transcript_239/g.521 Transcript_239/m.521 type:complete len:434 (-) Transcript_239:40-1341(-)
MSYERRMAGAHFEAIHSARRRTLGTEPNSAVKRVAPPDGEERRSKRRVNWVCHSSSVGASVPLKEVTDMSRRAGSWSSWPWALERLEGRDILRRARREAASPMERRLVLDPSPERTLPEMEMVGSIRMERMVYMSRMVGSMRGPPMKGEDSGEEADAPKSSPCLTTITFPINASPKVSGTSTCFPPKSPSSNPPPFFFSLPSIISSSPAPNTATFTAPRLAALTASRAATLTALLIKFSSFPIPRSSAVLARSTRRFSSITPSYVHNIESAPRHHVATADDVPSTPSPLPFTRRASAEAPANSMEPPARSMAESVSAVSATSAAPPPAPGADTTNHRTDPPRRADSTEAISPMPPGGEMTTRSGAAEAAASRVARPRWFERVGRAMDWGRWEVKPWEVVEEYMARRRRVAAERRVPAGGEGGVRRVMVASRFL